MVVQFLIDCATMTVYCDKLTKNKNKKPAYLLLVKEKNFIIIQNLKWFNISTRVILYLLLKIMYF